MATPIPLYPLNDFIVDFQLKQVDTTTGTASAITSGSVTAFLATSSGPTATAADSTLSVACVYATSGKWIASFDAATLTAALLSTLFAAVTPYLIISKASDVRLAVQLAYSASRDVTPT